MPGFDKSGPKGNGAQTGRGFGRCNPEPHIWDDEMPQRRRLRQRLRISRNGYAENQTGCGRGNSLRGRFAGKRGCNKQ